MKILTIHNYHSFTYSLLRQEIECFSGGELMYAP